MTSLGDRFEAEEVTAMPFGKQGWVMAYVEECCLFLGVFVFFFSKDNP